MISVGTRHGVQTFEKAPVQGPQPTKGWAVTEKQFNSFQLLLVATYPAIVRLEFVQDLYQR